MSESVDGTTASDVSDKVASLENVNEPLIPVMDAIKSMTGLNESRLTKCCENGTWFSATQKARSDAEVARVLKTLVVKEGGNHDMFLHEKSGIGQVSNDPVVFATIISPRQYGAFNNGPDGSFTAPAWGDPGQVPSTVVLDEVRISTNNNDSTKSSKSRMVKKTVDYDGKTWQSTVWSDCFNQGTKLVNRKRAEWGLSGPPLSGSKVFSQSAHKLIDEFILRLAKESDKAAPPVFNSLKDGPGSKMYLLAKRDVLISRAAEYSEGRISEYENCLETMGWLTPEDNLRFNTVPIVRVRNAITKELHQMSFHDLHMLGSSVVLQVMTTPRIYKLRNGMQWNWEYQLVAVNVLGRRNTGMDLSPAKAVKRAFDDCFSDSDDEDSNSLGKHQHGIPDSPTPTRQRRRINS